MESIFQALDLCLACKGCKAECPSGVDMAKLKYEFENEYYKTHRRPLRDYLFGYFHVVAKWLTPIAPLANWLMNFSLTRKLIARSLGLAEERALPRFSSRRVTLSEAKSLRHGEEILRPFGAQNDTPLVIFLPDVFSRFIEPQVEDAALDVLTKCGYDVRVLSIVGAGASLLSKGFVEAARRHARKTLEMLNQLDPSREAVIVGVEPPEMYLLKHDYVDLLPERAEEIEARAKRVWLLDEFLLRSKEFDALRVGRLGNQNLGEEKKQRIFFHPHCHQRAEGPSADGVASGANVSVELLRVCGYDVELSDAGCCGMAGTFGFEAEHYEVSMKVGELRLLPKIRDWRLETGDFWVASTGAACRMQVRHGVGAEARHPIEWVRDWLTGNF
jgi:Fe-S oxidoreductase